MQGQSIVAHFRDGRMLKGVSLDVRPDKPVCHVKPETGEVVEVRLHTVKALFFVKTPGGQPEYQESKAPVDGDQRQVGARKVRIAFEDGEEIVGLMNRYPPTTPFFFMLPIDPGSNNVRILVNKSAVKKMSEWAAPKA
ncbi:MAG: hypothetical protein HOP28_14085 [Gemmatimonadales bacterium]|nr:hypothetical protein [Gemmatimonadales bacterium]